MLKFNKEDVFYGMIVDSFYEFKGYYSDLYDCFQEQMKILKQFLARCQRESYGYEKNRIIINELYVGECLNHIRLSLALSLEAFPKRLGWDTNGMAQLYSNQRALHDSEIQDLLHLFKEMEPLLREDQIRDVEEFKGVLTNGKLDDEFAFKFCKNTQNDRN